MFKYLLISSCVLVFPGNALAQVAAPPAGVIFNQTKPQEVLPTAPGEVIELPPESSQFDQLNMPINVSRFVVEGATLIPVQELLALLQDLPSQSLARPVLNEAQQRVTRYYQSKGYGLAYAYVPPQTITDGIVTLRVIEPHYDRIELTENSRLNPEQALNTVGVQSGEPVQQNPLDRGLLLLNQTPGVQVQGVLTPGAQPGTTTLRLNIQDTPLLTGGVSINNYGNEVTGRARVQFHINIDNPDGYGSQVALNGMATEGGLLKSISMAYLTGDLRDGLRASLYGQLTNYRLGGAFKALDQTGRAEQYGAALSYPLVLTPSKVLNVRLDAMQMRYASNGSTLDNAAHTNILRLSLAGAKNDNLGTGFTSVSLNVTLGNQSYDTIQSRLSDAVGAKATGRFQILQFNIQRNQPLLRTDWLLQVGINGQLASKNLDPSQKLYLGGPHGVMSAPVSDLGGDQGVILRARLAHPLELPTHVPGRLAVALLLQGGGVQIDRNPFSGSTQNNWQSLIAGGAQLQYIHNNHWRMQLDCSARLSGVQSVGASRRLWLSIAYEF